jgi:DNA-binding MarR family transcriptional regulator
MTSMMKKNLERQVILGARDYGIGSVLFRHAVGEKLGLNATDMECLGVLFHKGISTPSELAKHTGLSSGATTAMLDRLVKSGLVARKPNPNDRRGVHIVIVKETAAKVAPLFDSARRAQDSLVSSLSVDELETLALFFDRYRLIWEEERAKVKSQDFKRK